MQSSVSLLSWLQKANPIRSVATNIAFKPPQLRSLGADNVLHPVLVNERLSHHCNRTMSSTAKAGGSLPRPLVVCGPSGVGKSTLINRLNLDYPNSFGFTISHTTRSPRPGEQNGVHYHYVDQATFNQLVKAGAFIEHAQFSGNQYGTSFKAVTSIQEQGKTCILDIEMQGVIQIKKRSDIIKPHFVFIKPPSLRVLEERLRGRKTEDEEHLQSRLEAAAKEMEFGNQEGNFDVIIVNNDLDLAYEEFKAFIVNETDILKS